MDEWATQITLAEEERKKIKQEKLTPINCRRKKFPASPDRPQCMDVSLTGPGDLDDLLVLDEWEDDGVENAPWQIKKETLTPRPALFSGKRIQIGTHVSKNSVFAASSSRDVKPRILSEDVVDLHPDDDVDTFLANPVVFPQEKYCPEARPHGYGRHTPERERVAFNSQQLINQWREELDSSPRPPIVQPHHKKRVISTPRKRGPRTVQGRKSVNVNWGNYESRKSVNVNWGNYERPYAAAPMQIQPRFSVFHTPQKGPSRRRSVVASRFAPRRNLTISRKRELRTKVFRLCREFDVRPIILSKKIIINLYQRFSY